jgi:hypothetical protein
MKNGFPAPNKELAKTKNNHLTGKAPYKFESGLLQRGVRCELDDFGARALPRPGLPDEMVAALNSLPGGRRWFAQQIPEANYQAAQADGQDGGGFRDRDC